ncbi:MAG: protein phosphatase 2C domain-containing protein [Oscillospiraceae bacterium]|nr:protein phosphatase 2C domain-containing protein [Oscillospiraceae bacterium]
MKITCRMETGIGKTEAEDRLLVGSNILAGGSFNLSVKPGGRFVAAAADGVGGNRGGAMAAHMAAEGLAQLNLPGQWQADTLMDLIREINMRIVEKSRYIPELHKMASTLSGICCIDGRWLLFHVGNTRVYAWNRPYLTQLTQDHSLSFEMKQQGWSEEQIQNSGRANQINACLGNGDPSFAARLQVADVTEAVASAQMLLLTTDGVHEYIPANALEYTFQQITDPGLYLEQAMAFARKNGSEDDLSMMLIDLQEM